jgi:RES domain-containing protein
VLTAWRIVKKQHAARAFDGEGARLFGGRWNSPGMPAVYVAATRALAVLEMAVHLDRAMLLASFALVPCRFDKRLVRKIDRDALPDGWRREPAPPNLAAIGDRWIIERRSAVLAVPSAVIEEETNFLLNPNHPDFAAIEIGRPERFEFDRRLIK